MVDKKNRFVNQYTNYELGDKPTQCDVNDNKVLQEFAQDCNINVIIKKYTSGEIDKLPVARDNKFGDETLMPHNYEDAKALVKKVESDFYSLPADVKREFDNSPDTYISEFGKVFTDKAIGEKFAKLGIFNSKSVEKYPTSQDSSLLTMRGDSTNDVKSSDVTDNNNLQKGSDVNGTDKV